MTIPYDVDWTQRNSVLIELAADVRAAGGTLVGLDPSAGETHPNWVVFLNQICAAMNALGANPPLPIYQSLDRQSFGSVVNAILSVVISSPPVNITSPSIVVAMGDGSAGNTTLASNFGTWSGEPSLSRQWQNNGVPNGATGGAYISQPSDSGASISCPVTATNAGGTVTAPSNSITLT